MSIAIGGSKGWIEDSVELIDSNGITGVREGKSKRQGRSRRSDDSYGSRPSPKSMMSQLWAVTALDILGDSLHCWPFLCSTNQCS